MKLFYSPGACSLGIHVLLEELGRPYTTQRVNFREDQQHSTEYRAKNPKSKVPTLERNDGSIVTEYGAITHYLTHDTPLAPKGLEAEIRTTEALDYIVGTIHAQGFTRMFRPSNFAPNAADQEWVKNRGRDIAAQGFSLIAATLGEQDYLFGNFAAVDCALFYVERWGAAAGVTMPAALSAHLARMKMRPSVVKALAEEGIS